MKRWLQFFRFPNLPTAPGDALAGAAFFLPAGNDLLPQALVAGVSALFFYMFGLADNDIVDAKKDAHHAPERPIPRGAISLNAARFARSLCLFAAYAVPVCTVGIGRGRGQLPFGWLYASLALVLCICASNRLKRLWLMGYCRGLSLACGAFAVWAPLNDPTSWRLVSALAQLAVGWTLYTVAVAKLRADEGRASAALGCERFFFGLAAFVPLTAFLPIIGSTEVGFASSLSVLLPVMGCLFAFLAWCAAVAPLGRPHDPAERRRAVGRTMDAIMFLQVGFMLITPRVPMLVVASVLWFGARLARRGALLRNLIKEDKK